MHAGWSSVLTSTKKHTWICCSKSHCLELHLTYDSRRWQRCIGVEVIDIQIYVAPVHVAHDSAHRELAMWIYLYDVTRIDGEARVCSVVTVGRRREVTHHQYRSTGKKDASQWLPVFPCHRFRGLMS